jgi:hypothetical protein
MAISILHALQHAPRFGCARDWLSMSLGDLDELVMSCRTDAGRRYIAEAVTCYKAGAYLREGEQNPNLKPGGFSGEQVKQGY